MNSVLVIAPHPDDAELGCGATISKLIRNGCKVSILTLTDRSEFDIEPEVQAAAKELGLEENIKLLNFPHRDLWSSRAGILRTFERARDTLDLDVVFTPAPDDLHQDHQVSLEEAKRAFKGTTLWGYEILRSNFSFAADVFVEVEKEDVERKVKAIKHYHTQANKLYCRAEAIFGLARVRGAMCGAVLAEGFKNIWQVL